MNNEETASLAFPHAGQVSEAGPRVQAESDGSAVSRRTFVHSIVAAFVSFPTPTGTDHVVAAKWPELRRRHRRLIRALYPDNRPTGLIGEDPSFVRLACPVLSSSANLTRRDEHEPDLRFSPPVGPPSSSEQSVH